MSYFLISLPLPNPTSLDGSFYTSQGFENKMHYHTESLNSINDSKIEHIFTLLKTELLSSTDFCLDVLRWNIPSLKFGTLDSLLNISDDLSQLDIHFESFLKRLWQQFYQLTSYANEKISDVSLLLPELNSISFSSPFIYKSPKSSSEKPDELLFDSTESFLTSFQWNNIKYRYDIPLSELILLFSSEVKQLDTAVKNSMSSFQSTLSQLLALKKKQHGSLAVKPLSDIIPPSELEITESEFMQRVLLAVPIAEEESFLANYEQYSLLVIPRSATLLCKDSEYLLYSVYVFNKYVAEFKSKARESRMIIRDIPSPAESKENDTNIEGQLSRNLYMEWSEAITLIQTSFTEAYSIYLHLKTVRIFAESILKYGLPAVYGTFLIHLSPTTAKKHLCEKFWMKHITHALKNEISFETNDINRFYSKKNPILSIASSEDPMLFETLPFILYRVTANFDRQK